MDVQQHAIGPGLLGSPGLANCTAVLVTENKAVTGLEVYQYRAGTIQCDLLNLLVLRLLDETAINELQFSVDCNWIGRYWPYWDACQCVPYAVLLRT